MTTDQFLRPVSLCLSVLLLSGCVMAEKYKAEKARSLNFQRLLAQEEKRTGTLDSDLRRVKRDNSDLLSRTRDLEVDLQAVRAQLATQQEEAAMQEAERQREQARMELGEAEKLLPEPEDLGEIEPEPLVTFGGAPRSHVVARGDTLYRLSRRYGVRVEQIREWNNLSSNVIVVGRELIVGYE